MATVGPLRVSCPAAALAGTALPTGTASYLGVYESGPPQTYQPVTDFARTVGKAPNLVGYYSGWKEPFQTSFAEKVHAHGAVTVVQIDPTDVWSRRSPRATMTATCAHMPTASGASASRWSSGSATR